MMMNSAEKKKNKMLKIIVCIEAGRYVRSNCELRYEFFNGNFVFYLFWIFFYWNTKILNDI